MNITGTGLLIILLADTVASLFIGILVGRILTRYPFGVSGFTGAEGMIGRKCIVTSVSDQRIEVKIDSQVWAAKSINDSNVSVGDRCVVKDVDGITLLIQKMRG